MSHLPHNNESKWHNAGSQKSTELEEIILNHEIYTSYLSTIIFYLKYAHLKCKINITFKKDNSAIVKYFEKKKVYNNIFK